MTEGNSSHTAFFQVLVYYKVQLQEREKNTSNQIDLNSYLLTEFATMLTIVEKSVL